MEQDILKYTTSQAGDMFRYLQGQTGGGEDYEYNGLVSGKYGNHAIFKLGDSYYNKIYIYVFNGRSYGRMSVIAYNEDKDIDGVLIFEAHFESLAPWSYTMYYDYWIVYRQLDALVMIINSLPTSDPHVAGRAWNSSGTLKISAG